MIKLITGLITLLVMSPFFVSAQNKNQLIALEVQGDTLANRQDYNGALGFYNSVIDQTKFTSPRDYDVMYKRAVAFFQLKEYDKALQDLDVFIEETGDEQGFILKAYVYQDMKAWTEVIAQLDTLDQWYPDNTELIQWRIQVLMDAGMNAEAKEVIQKALASEPNRQIKLYLGLVHYYLAEYKEAFATFDALIKEDSTQLEPYLYASSLCLEDEYYDFAIKYLDAGLTQHPANPSLAFYKGIALYELKQEEEGCRYLRKAFYAGVDDAADYLTEYCFGTED
ncbi:MAG TPA: tetratricopeptide repeat protein [Ohtaekwangia sp.]|nr:tetratricopeptide repeat protein [Ohtaekwangia sp.]